MRLTKDTGDELNSMLIDLLDTVNQLTDGLDTWLDEDQDKDDRAEARGTIEEYLPDLEEQCYDVLKLLNKDKVK